VRNDNVGDVLCCTPAIRALRSAFPKAYLAALVVRYSQDAITGNPDLDEVYIYEKAKHRPDRNRFHSLYRQFRVEEKLRKRGFDLAIGMRSIFSWSEAWLVYYTGAPFRLGYAPENGKDLKFAFFYNLGAHPPDFDGHEVEKALHLVKSIGVQPVERHLTVFIPEEDKKRVEIFLREHKVDPGLLIGFHLSSRVPANRWGADNFVTLACRLINGDRKTVVLTWGPGDEALAEEVRARTGALLYPTPTFKSLGALQQRCRVFLSSDGGGMHFATAVETPTVGLFGKTDPRMWGPWGNTHIALSRQWNASLIPVDEVYQSLKKLMKTDNRFAHNR